MCNCKGKPQVINNLKSKNHLAIAFDTYLNVIRKKDKSELDELDLKEINYAFYSIYPNAKPGVDLDNQINSITWVYEKYYNG